MPRVCAVPGCKSNNSGWLKENKLISTFGFPKDKDRRDVWIRAINRKNWKPSVNSAVCCNHFDKESIVESHSYFREGKTLRLPTRHPRLTADAIPLIFNNLPKHAPKEPSRHKSRVTDSRAMATLLKYHKCPICPYMTTLTFRKESHILHHGLPKKERLFNCANSIKSLKCFQCDDFESYKLADAKKHLMAGHTVLESAGKRYYYCEKCKFWTYSKHLFLRHKSFNMCVRNGNRRPEPTSPEEKPKAKLKCEFCELEYSFKHNLETHVLAKHTDADKIQWFECSHCPHKSKTRLNLESHMEHSHGIREVLKCEFCHFESKSKDCMKLHVLVKHTEPDKILWNNCEFCEHKAKTVASLYNHVRRVHGQQFVSSAFKCDRCQFGSHSKYELQTHVLVKHTE